MTAMNSERRVSDTETKERLIRLETGLNQMSIVYQKMETTLEKHFDQEAANFKEITRTLFALNSSIEKHTEVISDLKDSVKELRKDVDKNDDNVKDLLGCQKEVEGIKQKVGSHEQKIVGFEGTENKAKGAWWILMQIGTFLMALLAVAKTFGWFN